MRTRIRFTTILLTVIFIASMIYLGCSKQPSENEATDENMATESSQRPMLSKAEKAFEMLQVQNTYSKHAYYHAYPHLYCQELEDIWVDENGPNAETATRTNPDVL